MQLISNSKQVKYSSQSLHHKFKNVLNENLSLRQGRDYLRLAQNEEAVRAILSIDSNKTYHTSEIFMMDQTLKGV